jgi:metal-responsive CopG/Arc/MetJ family transcriptional regulator
MRRVYFSIDDELLNKVNATCQAKHSTRSEYIRSLIFKEMIK